MTKGIGFAFCKLAVPTLGMTKKCRVLNGECRVAVKMKAAYHNLWRGFPSKGMQIVLVKNKTDGLAACLAVGFLF